MHFYRIGDNILKANKYVFYTFSALFVYPSGFLCKNNDGVLQ